MSYGFSLFCLLLPPVVVVVILAAIPSNATRSSSNDETYYVIANKNTTCPKENQCHPLSYYVNQTSKFFASNKTMVFFSGNHSLDIEHVVNITNITKFNMSGHDPVVYDWTDQDPKFKIPRPGSRIICHSSTGFFFGVSRHIVIQNIEFQNCGVFVELPDRKLNVSAAVFLFQSTDLSLSHVVIRGSKGFGLHADRILGGFNVTNCAFLQSRAVSNKYYGGNARFWYSYPLEKEGTPQVTSNMTLVIRSSWFLYGQAGSSFGRSGFPSNASGLMILIYHPSVHVLLDNITAACNQGDNGGNIAIKVTDFLENTSTIYINNSYIAYGKGHKGGGLRFWYLRSYENKSSIENPYCQISSLTSTYNVTVMNISKTQFYNNTANTTGGAIYISHYELDHIDCVMREVKMYNCNFTYNHIIGNARSHSGAALEIIKHAISDFTPHNVPQFTITIGYSHFNSNALSNMKTEGGIVDVISTKSVNITSCKFFNNSGSALYLRDSSVIFQGNISFKNNHATYGAAIKFCDTSMMYIRNKTVVTFQDNSVTVVGGAIYITQEKCEEIVPPCFFQPIPDYPKTQPTDLRGHMRLIFINNTATVTGDAIYGGSVDYCYPVYPFAYQNTSRRFKNGTATQIFNAIFNLSQQFRESLSISSDPYGVCFCKPNESLVNTTIDCKKRYQSKTVYPGQVFNVSVTSVGQRNGIIPNRIEASLRKKNDPKHEIKQLGLYDKYNTPSSTCQTLQYQLFTDRSTEIVILSVMRVSPAEQRYFRFTAPKVNVSLSSCPWGFKLRETPPYSCVCNEILEEHNISCEINTQTVQRPHGYRWIGNKKDNSNNRSTDALVYLGLRCPTGYCKPDAMNISLSTINRQCDGNRKGVLCGACPKNYSVAIGTTDCLKSCPKHNLYILLSIFAVAGIILILFLTICNLTVTEGTINGLLFYANIVHQYKHIFFPHSQKNYNLLRVFIAWLNLDFGFRVCFYPNMTMYVKTWLQFGFILYIWVLEVLIIWLSHKYIFFTRLVGRNVVKVLATLLLITYPKLLKTAINSVRFSHILRSEGESEIVWSMDGNIEYIHGKHLPLFATGLILCMFAAFYVFTLLFIQCLQRRSHLCCLKWVEKLRPFFDSYTGLFRDNYRFWPGFLLFCRAILFILSALFDNRHKIELYLISGTCVVILVFACVSPHGIYKKWPLNILELSFVLNLGVLSGTVLAYKNLSPHVQSHNQYVTFPSVGITVATFALIIGLQVQNITKNSALYRRLSVWYIRRQWNANNFITQREGRSAENAEEAVPILRQDLPPVVRFDQYREPLMEDLSK